MELTPEEKELHRQTVQVLKGSERRMYMARVVRLWGEGGQACAERELGWNRRTIRKGMQELETGPIQDRFGARGRKRSRFGPKRLEDIRAIVDGQPDRSDLSSQRLYTRLSAREVRQQLIEQNGYTDAQLPSEETIRVRINDLGYGLRPVRKSQPKKR
jgi:hypothetical protein